MGLSSLRRHRGDYLDRALVKPDPSKEQLAEQLAAEQAKRAALEAELAAAKAAKLANKPDAPPPVADSVEAPKHDAKPIRSAKR
jgi:hypothetical protein